MILQQVASLYKKQGAERHYYISQKLRELGKFVISMRKISKGEVTSFTDCIHPHKFDLLVAAVQSLAGYDTMDSSFKIPTLATKLGNIPQKCAAILQSNAIKTGDDGLLTRA